MLRPVRTVAPAADLLDIDAVKLQLHEDGTDQDSLIEALIAAATAHLDGYSGILGRCLINQTWRQDFEAFATRLRLPFPDVSSVSSLQYYDANNAQQTVADANYQLLEDELGAFIELSGLYTPPVTYGYRRDAVSVTFVAGYGPAASDVHPSVIPAALMLIGHWYENREAVNIGNIVSELPFAVRALLAPVSRKAF